MTRFKVRCVISVERSFGMMSRSLGTIFQVREFRNVPCGNGN